MPTVQKGPPETVNWFTARFDDYERLQVERAAFVRAWWAADARSEAFSRAQRGGN